MDKSKLETESIPKLLMEFSVPSLIGSLVYILYNIVDRIFISIGIGRLALAGISVTLPLFTFILATGLLIGVGSGALISLNLGAKKKLYAENILGNAVVLFFIVGGLYTVLGLIFIDDILKIFGASADTLPYARDYMSIIFYALFFQLSFIAMNNIIRGEGSPKVVMRMSFIGCGLNIALDPLFIFVFDMGIKGAALATIISSAIVATVYFYYFCFSKSSKLKLKLINLSLKKNIIMGIISIGVAPFILQVSNSIVVIFINKQLNIYGGDILIAAYGIINSLGALIYMPIISIYQGSQPIIGFNYGAGNYTRVKSAFILAIKVASSISAISFIAAVFFPDVLISPFIKNDAELIDSAIRGLRLFFSAVFCLGFHVIVSTYFQSVGKARITTMINITKQVAITIPLLIMMPKLMGIDGIWMANPIADAIIFSVCVYLFKKELKVLKSKENQARIETA